MSSSLKGPGESQSHDGSKLRIAIVHARWNAPIIAALVAGARRSLLEAGVREENIVVKDVPGSWELPLGVQRIYASSLRNHFAASSGPAAPSATDLLSSSLIPQDPSPPAPPADDNSHPPSSSTAPFSAIIAIGVLIKGDTMHFEYIADATVHGLMRVQLDTGVPVVLGVLTCLDEEQAKVRAGMEGRGHCHGEDWGRAAVELGVQKGERGEGEGSLV